eukprot:TRINITY_DN5482_c0_g1_i1.p1 TRINITY_DN5482_c0_g1~~TRINITY_DN5482_c0_g1_i1.p1  ORF type:complete len:413 (-),score=75.61 TRINITY_DN5482_c0_g1_i1:159-1397(-)
MKLLVLGVVPLVLMGLLFYFPRCDHEEVEAQLLTRYLDLQRELSSSASPATSIAFPIMTFNIRLDGLESDPNNHWTKRVYRVRDTLERWKPFVVGLQEPFAGQVLHLQSIIPSRYQPIGFDRSKGQFDLGHPSRHHDMRVAMLYDTEALELLEQDYLWLSKTLRVIESKDWNSFGIRTLNIARFRMKKTPQQQPIEVLLFNTHLDVGSEEARRRQSEIVARTIADWQAKYPNAITFLLGDFNTAPGQAAYMTLTRNTTLSDAWIVCKANTHLHHHDTDSLMATCDSNSIASSYHGWKGTRLNSYGVRLLQGIALTLHGMGFELKPRKIPENWSEFREITSNLVADGWQFPIREAIPSWPWNRFHVDWILFSSGSNTVMTPRVMAVADVRDSDYSSDHFPVVGLFEISTKTFA